MSHLEVRVISEAVKRRQATAEGCEVNDAQGRNSIELASAQDSAGQLAIVVTVRSHCTLPGAGLKIVLLSY